ncbi:MAG: response regulator transcription factor [Ktedonobacteraceae bacterium]|nr:response regulator transcription factor [Ktedonobacteraceae bacterium]
MAQVGILEDNARIAKFCATYLRFEGHEVIVYEHPRECLAALLPPPKPFESSQTSSLPVDVLILDLHLPDISGMEVLHSLRSYPQTQALPLIFCTAATSIEIVLAKRLAPEAEFIEKPFKLQTLISAVRAALNK